jgi:hypothetical protein
LGKAAAARGRGLTLASLSTALGAAALPSAATAAAAAAPWHLDDPLILRKRSRALSENKAAEQRTRQRDHTRQAILKHKKQPAANG